MRYAFLLVALLAVTACEDKNDEPDGAQTLETPGALARPPSGDRVPADLRPPR